MDDAAKFAQEVADLAGSVPGETAAYYDGATGTTVRTADGAIVSSDLYTMDGKGSLELIRWRDEPAVIVDGKWIIRRTTLIQELTRGMKR